MSTKSSVDPFQWVATTPMTHTSLALHPQIDVTARAFGDVGGGTCVHLPPSQWKGPAGPPTQTSSLELAQIVVSPSVGDGIVDQAPPA